MCHYITTASIRTALLQQIQTMSQYAISDEAAFAEQVRALSELRHAESVKTMTAEATQARKRIAELDTIIQKLYESYALGKIPESRFTQLSSAYEKEQAELKSKLATMTEKKPIMQTTRRYGRTLYTISAFGKVEGTSAYEDRLLLIRLETEKRNSGVNHSDTKMKKSASQ